MREAARRYVIEHVDPRAFACRGCGCCWRIKYPLRQVGENSFPAGRHTRREHHRGSLSERTVAQSIYLKMRWRRQIARRKAQSDPAEQRWRLEIAIRAYRRADTRLIEVGWASSLLDPRMTSSCEVKRAAKRRSFWFSSISSAIEFATLWSLPPEKGCNCAVSAAVEGKGSDFMQWPVAIRWSPIKQMIEQFRASVRSIENQSVHVSGISCWKRMH